MLKFKNKKTGLEVEVTEEFANQVLRPQGKYEEVKEAPKVNKPEVVAPKVSKKKTSKKSK